MTWYLKTRSGDSVRIRPEYNRDTPIPNQVPTWSRVRGVIQGASSGTGTLFTVQTVGGVLVDVDAQWFWPPRPPINGDASRFLRQVILGAIRDQIAWRGLDAEHLVRVLGMNTTVIARLLHNGGEPLSLPRLFLIMERLQFGIAVEYKPRSVRSESYLTIRIAPDG